MRILLVEDEPDMAANIAQALGRQDMIIDHAPTIELATEAILAGVHDAVLLDRRLPDGEGLDLLPVIRKHLKGVPVIVLSALKTSPDRVAGLELGADDYLSKPFTFDEMLARLRAVLRRSAVLSPDVIRVGNVTFDTQSRQAAVNDVLLPLPRREMLILETLIRRAGRAVTREGLEDAVFNFDDEIASNTLDAHISRLRKRLTQTGASVEIRTLRGVGHLLKAL
ncbi:response regulator transcription factor [Devosia sp. 1566]|uniref:response regulator transcription factor n=1 Tax=unclassified Devosia TaxID=196773 RepID=UPI000FDCBCC2|nr:response regulator transcription factor [Devosia sp. 1566]